MSNSRANAGQMQEDSRPTEAVILNHRIAGTRITVWDIVYYLERGTSQDEIAQVLCVSPGQVQAAVEYIEEHKAEVMATHRRIEERIARGNPPEVQAKLKTSHARFLEKVKAIRQARSQEANGARNSGGQ